MFLGMLKFGTKRKKKIKRENLFTFASFVGRFLLPRAFTSLDVSYYLMIEKINEA